MIFKASRTHQQAGCNMPKKLRKPSFSFTNDFIISNSALAGAIIWSSSLPPIWIWVCRFEAAL